MKKNNIITATIAIAIGISMITSPFFFQLKKSIILIGIVPLWMGLYTLLNINKQKNKNKTKNRD